MGLDRCRTRCLLVLMENIKSIERFGEPWESKYGKMYPFSVVLENGETVYANAASETPWWGPGSIVEMTVKGETKKGNKKVSFGKPEGVAQPPRPSPSGNSSGNRDEAISLAMVFKIAAERGGTPSESLSLARELWSAFKEFQGSPEAETVSSSEEEAF